MSLIKPITKEVNGKAFVLSKLPASVGRKIAAIYAQSLATKLEDYDKNEAAMYLLISYVGVPNANPSLPPMMLNNPALVDNHVTDWEMLVSLEKEMVEYNVSFLPPGGLSVFLKGISQVAQVWNTKTSTASSAPSSPKSTRRSTNSKRSTA